MSEHWFRIFDDADKIADSRLAEDVFYYLCRKAETRKTVKDFNGVKVPLKAGQCISGRKEITNKINEKRLRYKVHKEATITEGQVEAVLKRLKKDQLIVQRPIGNGSVFTIVPWNADRKKVQPNDREKSTILDIRDIPTEIVDDYKSIRLYLESVDKESYLNLFIGMTETDAINKSRSFKTKVQTEIINSPKELFNND